MGSLFSLRSFILVASFFASFNLVFSQCPTSTGPSCDASGTALDLYWVGTTADNSGNWNSPCSWRVGSATGVEPCQSPRSIDNVIFDISGFNNTGSPTITINSHARCNDFFVSPGVNALTVTPEFELVNPGFMEIYGFFFLETNLTWTVVGGNNTGPEVLFKAVTPGKIIKTAGHTMGAVQFDGIGGGWMLLDDFNAGSLNFVFGHLSTSDGATSHDMNLMTFDSDVVAGGNSTNRRLDLNNSTITISGPRSSDRYPFNTTNAPTCVWECRGTSSANFDFNAGQSEIIFTETSPFLRLGGIDYNRITHTGTGRFYDHFGPNPCNIDTMTTNGFLFFHHQHIFNVLEINSVSLQHDFFQNQTITGDLIVSGNDCNPTVFKSESNRLLTMPASVSADPMNGYLINNLRCSDGSATGHTVSGFGLGNTTGWDISSPTSRDLYWVGNTNNNWSEPTNWSTSPTGSPLLTATSCPPTQEDNVFFISPLADNDIITLNTEAFCNNKTWNMTAPATINGNQDLNIYGNLQLDTDMTLACTRPWNFFGDNGNTILSAGKTLPSTSYIQQDADYTLLDDLNFNALYLFRQDNFNSGGFDMTGNVLLTRVGVQDFSGSTITLASSIPWQSNGNQGTTTYDSNSEVIFTNTSATTLISGWGPNLKFPNFTLQSPNTQLLIRDFFGVGHSATNNNVVFEGDVTLNGSMRYYADQGNGTTPGNLKRMVITGDLNLAANKIYEFGVEDPILVGGDLNSLGSCSQAVTIKGIDGNSFDITITGTANIDYTNISDLHSTSPITATNSLDAGNNSNITITPAPALTYYWRALNGSCPSCTYTGNWNSTNGFWATNPAATVGTPGCIPGPSDNVVFDNSSFSGGAASITIPSSVAVHNITVINSNITLLGTGNLTITGSVDSDGSLVASGYTGDLRFVSNDGAGENIDFGGVNLSSDLIFANILGTWTLLNNALTTNKGLFLNAGELNTNGQTVNINAFNSNNSAVRTLNLGSSTLNVNGGGSFLTVNSPVNVFTWNTDNVSNFTFNASNAVVNFTSSAEPTILSGALTFNDVNFTSTNSTVSTSPVLLVDNWTTKYMKFDCSARIYGDNTYDTLEFTPGNVYRIEPGSVQTLSAPDGILLANGTPGNEIAIKSTVTGSFATFHKLNTGGSNSTFCFDYLSVEDNFASSDDPVFVFFTGINSNNISATGIWDFTRPIWEMPDIDSEADQIICPGSAGNLTWTLDGSGPYNITFTANGANPTTIAIPNNIGTYSYPVYPTVDTEYKVMSITSNDCIFDNPGTILDSTQVVTLPSPAVIAVHTDSANCNLNNEASFVDFHENVAATERPILSVSDDASGAGMGAVTATVRIDPTVQFLNTVPYLQRRFGIEPTTNESGVVRLYFTQAELNALSVAWGTTLTPSDLSVTKFDNNTLSFTGTSTLLPVVTSGSIPSGITTSSNILFVEVNAPSFSHFVIHPFSITPLPVSLTEFTAEAQTKSVELKWQTESETNSDFYAVERSANATDWEEIGQVKAAGNSSNIINYALIDDTPLIGVSYYRLIQTDFNGDYAIYGPKSVTFYSDLTITLFPNPATDQTQLSISTDYDGAVAMQLSNTQGQILQRDNWQLYKGMNQFTISTQSLSKGVYYVSLYGEDGLSLKHTKLMVK